mmetsp:Transcript_68755/g.183493  ORF Transcript_68755/g.183493 Transcript_68755/m.183493 type:complete len:102 (+) Transcript_68755:82-387(+)
MKRGALRRELGVERGCVCMGPMLFTCASGFIRAAWFVYIAVSFHAMSLQQRGILFALASTPSRRICVSINFLKRISVNLKPNGSQVSAPPIDERRNLWSAS